jgi:hypothetical protein
MHFLGYAIIIGAMKSGTTTLHCNLAQHPEIVTGTEKELDFFKRRKKPDVASYEALFPSLDKSRHAYTLDSSPNYTKTRKWSFAPRRIAALPGRKRLIYILRDPVARIDSHIAHNVAEGRWTVNDWSMTHVLDISAYARQLAKFEKVGLLGDVLLLDFAELCVDPVGVSFRVHDFLGIPRVPPRYVTAHNVRQLDAQFLRPDQVAELKDVLRDDVETLIKRYGFEAARSWGIAGSV